MSSNPISRFFANPLHVGGSGSLAEGTLEWVEGHKPVEIAQRSVIEVERVLGTVRESYPARRWSEALAAFLHDRDLPGQEWAREALSSIDMESWLRTSLSYF